MISPVRNMLEGACLNYDYAMKIRSRSMVWITQEQKAILNIRYSIQLGIVLWFLSLQPHYCPCRILISICQALQQPSVGLQLPMRLFVFPIVTLGLPEWTILSKFVFTVSVQARKRNGIAERGLPCQFAHQTSCNRASSHLGVCRGEVTLQCCWDPCLISYADQAEFGQPLENVGR